MDRTRLQELARKAMALRTTNPARETGYIYHHGLRVAGLAEALAAKVDPKGRIDRDVLWAGALLHDLGKGCEPHHEIGGQMAQELLEGVADDPQIGRISQIIAEHNQRDRPDECLPASRIVQDADTLDHFGAQGIWLAMGQAFNAQTCPAGLLDSQCASDAAKLRGWCRAHLNYDASRLAFDRRVAEQMRFLDSLARSEAGQL
jgi:uncharacterized protein